MFFFISKSVFWSRSRSEPSFYWWSRSRGKMARLRNTVIYRTKELKGLFYSMQNKNYPWPDTKLLLSALIKA